MERDRFVIVGAGLLGGAVGLALARRGAEVLLLERAVPGAEASSAAGGILAPRMEAHGHEPHRTFGVESLGRYRDWVAGVEARAGMGCDLRWTGLWRVVLPGEDPQAARPDAEARWVTRPEGVNPEALGAWELPEEGCVDPRRLVAAVHRAALAAGARTRVGVEVAGVDRHGVRLAGGERVEGRVVVCAGAWTGRVPGLEALPVRPVRGQMVALEGGEAPQRVLFGGGGYVVPRPDGRVVVGSTMEEVGFARGTTAGGLRHVLGVALGLVPGLAGARVAEHWSGFRPGTPDDLPLVGEVGGVFVASGHFRNGVLLAPITADWAAAALLDGVAPPAALDPRRFASR